MDGIDGIAASEAVFITAGGVALTLLQGASGAGTYATVVFGAACLGFLLWNWPPARIFMGDVGSGYLGYTIAILALGAARENATQLYGWLILGGVFFVDATVTLVRRLLRGGRVCEAHRAPGYQWLARRWQGHLPVTMVVLAVNLVWLAPFAYWCVIRPGNIPWYLPLSLLPLIVLTLIAGAGRKEVC